MHYVTFCHNSIIEAHSNIVNTYIYACLIRSIKLNNLIFNYKYMYIGIIIPMFAHILQ